MLAAPEYTFKWDRGIEDSEGQELTLILIGYYKFSTLGKDSTPPGYCKPSRQDTTYLCPRAMITIPSKTTAGAYERIGMVIPYKGFESDKWLNQCFDGVEKQEI